MTAAGVLGQSALRCGVLSPMEGDRPDAVWLCLVCGLDLRGIDDPPWGAGGTDPTYSFCPCCGVEFGYQDSSLKGIRRWRERWLQANEWDQPHMRPVDWSLDRQLAQLPERVT